MRLDIWFAADLGMKLHHLLAALAIGASATAAGAVVLIADRDQPGDQGVLYDSETQLDRLRGPPVINGFSVTPSRKAIHLPPETSSGRSSCMPD
jgi:hypothetical protein